MVEIEWLYGCIVRIIRVIYKVVRSVFLKEGLEEVSWLTRVPDLVVLVSAAGKVIRTISAGSFDVPEILPMIICEDRYKESLKTISVYGKESSFKLINWIYNTRNTNRLLK